MTWRLLLKGGAARCMGATGLLSLAEGVRLAGRAPIFMYHRVLEDVGSEYPPVQAGMYVRRETFRRQMAFLARRYRVVFLEELVERAAAGKGIGGLCAVTFDDGWRDNYSVAYPILKETGVPATVFLATGYTGTDRMFWPEEFSLLMSGGRTPIGAVAADTCSPAVAQFLSELGPVGDGSIGQSVERGINLLKVRRGGERMEILEFLGRHANLPRPARQMLDWEEVSRMHASGQVRFGAHTVNHELLDQLPPGRAFDEIAISAAHLEERLGRPTTLFAYPNGNHSGRVRRLLRKGGFRAAVTTRRGIMSFDSPMLELPRIGVHEDVCRTVGLFRARTVVPGF